MPEVNTPAGGPPEPGVSPAHRVIELERTVHTLQQLLSISRQLSATHEMRPLLQRIVDSTAELTNADGASILLMENGGTLRFAAACGPTSAALPGTEVPPNQSLAGWVVSHREMAIVENAQSDSRIYNVAGGGPLPGIDATQSIIAAPMVFGSSVVGVLEAVTTRTRHSFSQQDQETMATLAGVAAVAVQNTRLFQQSDWVAEVIHEIRTPLTAILSYADLLQVPDLGAEVRGRAVRTIKIETERLNHLATQFLDLARLESGRVTMVRERIDVSQLVSDAVEVIAPTAAQEGRTIQVSLACPLPEVHGDKQRLHQVLLNLLSNAVKYSDPSDRVTVQAESREGSLLLTVRDSGPGIPEEQIPLLFQKFKRLPGGEAKAEGTGLGLVLARQIVEAHRGRIWVESQLGQGSCFCVALPSHKPETT